VSIIRAYRSSDHISLLRVIDTVCAEGLMKTTKFQPTPAWDHALCRADCGHHLLLVCEDAGHLVGWCRLFPVDGALVVQVELGIGLLGSYRGQGMGSEMIGQSQMWARQASYQRIVLQVHPENAMARHVFGKCGFQCEDAVDNQLTMAQRLFAEERRL
jgi:RimJ/RimL family protein N-acetyltransferase